MKKIFLNLLPFFVLLGVLLFLFWQVFFKGYVFIDGDNFHLNMPMKYLLVDGFKNHYFPFWNPYILGGTPYAADMNLGTFNPTNILYFIFPIPRALTLQVILDLFLIGVFMYILLKQQVSKSVALFGSVTFMLSGSIFTFVSNSTILNVIVYIPLLFYLIQKYFLTKKNRYFIFLVVAQVLQILSGHPQVTYYTIFFISLYFLFQTSTSIRKRLIAIALYVACPLGIASFQLLPFMQYVLLSNRPVHSLGYATSGSYEIYQLLTTFFPTFFGTKLFGNWWGSQVMLTGYIGPAALVLFGIGLSSHFKSKSYFLFSLILSFLLSLGKWGVLYFLFYYFFPGWSLFRTPVLILVFTTFFACIFASKGFAFVLQKPKQFLYFGKMLFYISFIIAGFVLALFIITTHYFSWIIYLFIFHKALFYSYSKIEGINTGITLNVFIFTLILFITGLMLWKHSFYKKYIVLFFLTLTSITLLFFDSTYLQLAPLNFYKTGDVPQLAGIQSQQYRIYALPVKLSQDKRYFPGPLYFYRESSDNLKEITDNHALQYHIQSITGYTSLVLKNYATFIGGNNITGIDTTFLTQEKLNQLSVAYIFTLDKNGNLVVTQNPYALARVRFLNPTGEIHTVTSLEPNKFTVTASTQKQNTLIIADTYYPGWTALLNGKPTFVRQYKSIFQAIKIPKGNSFIVFSYDPQIWKIGIGVSCISVILFLLCVKHFSLS